MKIEKLNEDKIRITLNLDDLKEKNIKLFMVIYSSININNNISNKIRTLYLFFFIRVSFLLLYFYLLKYIWEETV